MRSPEPIGGTCVMNLPYLNTVMGFSLSLSLFRLPSLPWTQWLEGTDVDSWIKRMADQSLLCRSPWRQWTKWQSFPHPENKMAPILFSVKDTGITYTLFWYFLFGLLREVYFQGLVKWLGGLEHPTALLKVLISNPSKHMVAHKQMVMM